MIFLTGSSVPHVADFGAINSSKFKSNAVHFLLADKNRLIRFSDP